MYTLLSLLSLLMGPLCLQAFEKEQIQVVMGTTASVRVWAKDPATADHAIDIAFESMVQIDRLMSTYKPNSQVSQLNRTSPQVWTPIDPLLYDILQQSLHIAQQTHGAFDPTVLPLMYLWGFRGDQPQMPTQQALKKTLAQTGYHHIHLKPHPPHLRFDTAGIQLDLGGIAKGYALDLAAHHLQKNNIQTAVLDLGGNLRVLGTPKNQNVGIQHPLQANALLGTLSIQNASVATSGGYEKYIDIQGQRFGHILDPRTGHPVSDLLSVTIVAPTATWADALSTALFVMGPKNAITYLKTHPEINGLLVWQTGHQLYAYMSPHLKTSFISEDAALNIQP